MGSAYPFPSTFIAKPSIPKPFIRKHPTFTSQPYCQVLHKSKPYVFPNHPFAQAIPSPGTHFMTSMFKPLFPKTSVPKPSMPKPSFVKPSLTKPNIPGSHLFPSPSLDLIPLPVLFSLLLTFPVPFWFSRYFLDAASLFVWMLPPF
jgi:hypothetical protein